ncbi:MAG: SDR family oxidoreductase [Candidatus Aminicenantes bacterium]|nr:SDR family oxidoreductase [Candidatus Aminicenantes bacterium]
MNLGIKNKVALVTASSSGLGKAAAFRLAGEGALVAICARNVERLSKARDLIAAETGGVVKAYPVDVTDGDRIKSMVKAVADDLGPVEILVCNAGGPPPGLWDDFAPGDYRSAVELNLLSTIALCYETIPYMKEKNWGRIICIASISAKQPVSNLILSNTARAGVLGFAKSLSNQIARFGITVNSVCPGYTKTERVDSLAQSFAQSGKGTVNDFYKKLEAEIPMGRIGSTEEFAQTVAFLASEGAGYITGAAIQIDGGYIKGLF